MEEILQMLVPMILEGLKITLGVFFITLIFSIPLGVLVALLRMSKNPLISKVTAMYIYIMRGTPLLLQLMFIFFGWHMVPVIGVAVERIPAIMIAFVLNYAAYYGEIFRGGLNSIDKGQKEAGKVLGLSKEFTFRKILLPQMIRNVWPSVGNEIITLVKDTSLVYVLGVSDVMKAARAVSNRFSSFLPYVFVGLVYLLIVAVVTWALDKTEDRLNYY